MDSIILHGKSVSREAMVEFKKAYMQALRCQANTFKFDGQKVLTSYAKYLVEYAENELGVLK